MRLDAAHAAPAAARRRLDHQREPQPLRVPRPLPRQLSTGPPLHGATGTPGCSASSLAAHLVTQCAHDIGRRPDEHDAESLAQLGELRDARRRTPSPTHAASARVSTSAPEPRVVEVGAAAFVTVSHGRGAEAVPSSAWRTNSACRSGLGVERDDADRVVALVIELAHGVDRAHRGLAAVEAQPRGA